MILKKCLKRRFIHNTHIPNTENGNSLVYICIFCLVYEIDEELKCIASVHKSSLQQNEHSLQQDAH